MRIILDTDKKTITVPWNYTDNDMFETDKRIVIITYAKFGVLLDRDPDFHKHFDYIICDELHSLIKFQYFSRQPNYHSIAKRGLERAVRNDHTKVVALTATPTQVENEFDTPKYRIPIDDNEIIHYETKCVFRYTNLKETLKAISPDKTGLQIALRSRCWLSPFRPARIE